MFDGKPVVIVNPRSGGGLSERRWASLVAPLADGLGPFDTRFTEKVGDGARIARQEAEAGRTLVIAFGGDGTISEVAHGLVSSGKDVELGILPRGTGGDFRRTLDLPKGPREAARRLKEAPGRWIDVGQATFVDGEGKTTTRTFVNEASFGFSSAVASRANQSSKALGAKLSFLGATLSTLMGYHNVEVTIAVDGGAPQRRTVMLGTVGNGRFFGGGMKICPEAVLDDGRLDLVVVGDLSRFEVMTKIGSLYDGTHLKLKQVSSTRASRVEVRGVDPAVVIPVELDGETPGFLPASFEVLPRRLRVRF